MPKHHDNSQKPYQGIIESCHVSLKIKHALTKQLEHLSPFVLRKTMEEKLKKIFLSYTPKHPRFNDPCR